MQYIERVYLLFFVFGKSNLTLYGLLVKVAQLLRMLNIAKSTYPDGSHEEPDQSLPHLSFI